MNWRGTRQNRPATGVLCIVLLFVFSTIPVGCREDQGATAPAQSTAYSLNFSPGTQFLYDTYALSLSGSSQLPTTSSTTSWRVLTVQGQYQGKSNVTIVADSSALGRDTLYLASNASGDVYFYGFLARIMKRRRGFGLPPQWDLVASFSAGSSGLWTVGTADSLGQDVVYGNIPNSSDYYAASVDGVKQVFPAIRIDLTGQTLYYSIWFSNSPNAIVRMLEEPDYESNGELLELAVAKTGAR